MSRGKRIPITGFSSLDWSSGLWQRVRRLQGVRKGYMHRFLSEANLFPSPTLADEAIDTVRAAVEAIYRHVGRPAPAWIHDDDNRGWDDGRRHGATLTLIHAGASEENPKAIKICFVRSDREHLSEVLPAGTDYTPYVEDLIRRVRVPISAVRVYEGAALVHERETTMRGT